MKAGVCSRTGNADIYNPKPRRMRVWLVNLIAVTDFDGARLVNFLTFAFVFGSSPLLGLNLALQLTVADVLSRNKASNHISAMSSTHRQVLQLYRSLLRESKKFPSYNFRHYAVRKVRDSFRDNKKLEDTNQISAKLLEASKNLEIIKRQVIIGQMYSTDKLVIENVGSIHRNG